VAYLAGGRPAWDIFKPVDLAVHEWSHILARPFGQTVEILAGSLGQCLLPLLLILLFVKQRDYFAMAFCIGWLGLNLFDVAIYVADAEDMALPLVSPGGEARIHDWNYLLSRRGWLPRCYAIAAGLRAAGAVCVGLFAAVGGYLCVRMALDRRRRG
jgi:hypothetical protein